MCLCKFVGRQMSWSSRGITDEYISMFFYEFLSFDIFPKYPFFLFAIIYGCLFVVVVFSSSCFPFWHKCCVEFLLLLASLLTRWRFACFSTTQFVLIISLKYPLYYCLIIVHMKMLIITHLVGGAHTLSSLFDLCFKVQMHSSDHMQEMIYSLLATTTLL